MVVPGEFQVRLTAGDWSQTRPLRVVMDPRVEANGVTMSDLQAQFDFNREVSEFQVVAQDVTQRVQEAIDGGSFRGRQLEQLQELRARLVDRAQLSPTHVDESDPIPVGHDQPSRPAAREFRVQPPGRAPEQLDDVQARLSQIVREEGR